MFKRVVLALAGVVFGILGLVGLLLPFLPGLVFLAVALLCFAGASAAVDRRLNGYPRIRRWRGQWRRRTRLTLLDRCRLSFWLMLSIALEPWRRRT